jgi:hypothetical protein
MDSMFLYKPLVRNMPMVCTNSSSLKAYVANPPYNGNLSITIDGAPVTYNPADSSFQYFTSGSTTVGNHPVKVKFMNSKYNTETDTAFTVTAMANLTALISGNTVVSAGVPATITATPSNGSGTTNYRWQDSTASHSWADIPGVNSSGIGYLPANGNKLRCIITSSALCLNNTTATSNVLVFQVATALAGITRPDAIISVYPNPVSTSVEIAKLRAGKFHNIYQWVDYLPNRGDIWS